MLKIVGGKRYDTATAVLVAEYGNNLGVRDFKNCDESLYRTAKGNWFLHGSGGPLTQWAQPSGNGRTSGEAILPLTPDAAREWLEEHGCVDALEEYFGDSLEDA